jgi:hypothetical protein
MNIHFKKGVNVRAFTAIYYLCSDTSLAPADVREFEVDADWDDLNCFCTPKINICLLEEEDPGSQARKASPERDMNSKRPHSAYVNKILLNKVSDFKVFDFSGKQVHPYLEKLDDAFWNVSNLPIGLYLVISESGEKHKLLVR